VFFFSVLVTRGDGIFSFFLTHFFFFFTLFFSLFLFISTTVTEAPTWEHLDTLLAHSPASLCHSHAPRAAAAPGLYELDFMRSSGSSARVEVADPLADSDVLADVDAGIDTDANVRVLADDADSEGDADNEGDNDSEGDADSEAESENDGETDAEGGGAGNYVSVEDATSAMATETARAEARARSARSDLKQMKEVLSATQEFRAMQKEMESAAKSASQRQALHSMAFGGYLRRPLGCTQGAEDPLCESTGLMNGMEYLSSQTGMPLGGLFGGAQGLSMMAKIG
jgi:hypothetical protein